MKGRNIAVRACLPWIYTGGTSSCPAPYGGVLADTHGGSNMESMSAGRPAGMIVSSLSFSAVLDLNGPPTASTTSSANLATTSGLR